MAKITQLSDLYKLCMDDLPGIDTYTLDQALQQALRQFCLESLHRGNTGGADCRDKLRLRFIEQDAVSRERLADVVELGAMFFSKAAHV